MTTTDQMYLRGMQISKQIMLAHEFDPSKYTTKDYYVSPKLDGLRAIYDPHLGFFTRQGLPWPKAMTEHIRINPNSQLTLDGEFYCHGMSLQDINAAMSIARTSPTPETYKIQFHVFDSPNAGMSFLERNIRLTTDFNLLIANAILVTHNKCSCWATLFNNFQAQIAGGYEGVMLREPHTGYQSGRSYSLLKWKANATCKAESFSMQEGVGKFDGMMGAMKFRLDNGVEFAVGSGWTDEERLDIWKRPQLYCRRLAEIKYMTLSNDGTPKMSTFIKWIDPPRI